MRVYTLASLLILTFFAGCASSKECDSNQAYNKMLALQKVQGRLTARGGDDGFALSASIAMASVPVGELIAQNKFTEACAKAEEIAQKLGVNLAEEQKGMITMEQLAKDGGKGSGTCSIADAAKKNMEVHALLQAEVDAGKRSSEVFREFSDDTVGLAEMYSTDPSKACELLELLKIKYKL